MKTLLSLPLSALSLAHMAASTVFLSRCTIWDWQPFCLSQLSCAMWHRLGRRVPGHYPKANTNPFKNHPSALVIWFAKYSRSHTLLPLLSISVILPPFLHTHSWMPLVSRQGDLTCMRVLAYASLHLKELSACVCVCVFWALRAGCVLLCMLMPLGLGPRDQTGDDNPGGALCGPAHWAPQMGGEREGEL